MAFYACAYSPDSTILALHLKDKYRCYTNNLKYTAANFTNHLLLYHCSDVQIHSFLTKKNSKWVKQAGLNPTKLGTHRCYTTILI